MVHELVRWNTGRPYTAHGQIIAAQLQDDGSVLFADLSRMIDGRIVPPVPEYSDVRRYVMWAYDYNHYAACRKSWAFHNEMLRLKMWKTADGEWVT